MKKKMVVSYLMGLSMGVLLLLFILSFTGVPSLLQESSEAMRLENERLRAEVENLRNLRELSQNLPAEEGEREDSGKETSRNEESGKEESFEGESFEGEQQTETAEAQSQEEAFVLEISEPIRYDPIAEALVTNGVYPHKNDLLMLMEMIHYDKHRGAKVLADAKIISDLQSHRKILLQYDSERYAIRKELLTKELIQNEEAFSKVLFFFDGGTRITTGKKSFPRGISLREVADILTAEN